MIKVTQITNTCFACPAHWEGRTDDGKYVYIRYRWGHLSVRVHANEDKFEIDDLYPFDETIGNEFDGVMSYEELRDKVKDVVELPEYCLPSM
mgnify:CR=1 FL=1